MSSEECGYKCIKEHSLALKHHPFRHPVGSGGRAVERRTVNRGDDGSIPYTAVSKVRQFRSPPHLPVSFGRDTKSLLSKSLLSDVYAREVKYPTRINV